MLSNYNLRIITFTTNNKHLTFFVININMLQMDRNYSRPGHLPIPSTYSIHLQHCLCPAKYPSWLRNRLISCCKPRPGYPTTNGNGGNNKMQLVLHPNPRNLTTGISGLSIRRTSTTALNAQNIHFALCLEK